MERRFVYLIGLLLCACVLQAQVKNYISVWGDLGESSLLTDFQGTLSGSSMGVGAGVGFGYELQANHFLFTVGVSANVAHSAFDLSGAEYAFEAIDTESDPLTYIVSADNRKDMYTNTSVQIPLMLGGQFNRFFFLLGAKVDLSAYCASKVKAEISTKGDYPQFIDPFEHMPEHGFYDNATFVNKGKVTFNPNVMASAEIGWRLGEIARGTGYDVPNPKTIYRLSLFADYGLLDLHRRGYAEPFTWKEDMPVIDENTVNQMKMTDVLSTSVAAKAVNNLMVGVKFTVLFRLPERGNCVICKD
ncbi:MAG: hypothetical protein NC038_02125 [Paludibacter sp.]|nr:hypothetical protein [Bacteroidales bacterium]MCM1068473.1 hypothetical protein [Prevotella sp.]MCM1353427.1 hypothetical protein [Bacteroides sp.]MCM1442588.1 hypothetical protein [Muribaculum sp.]MCM1481433.1 hypothetical protein [Paludibacter sp.]